MNTDLVFNELRQEIATIRATVLLDHLVLPHHTLVVAGVALTLEVEEFEPLLHLAHLLVQAC